MLQPAMRLRYGVAKAVVLIAVSSFAETVLAQEPLEVRWETLFGDPILEERGRSVAMSSDGGFVSTGLAYVADAQFAVDLLLVKVGPSGEKRWSRTIDNLRVDEGAGIKATTDEGFIVVGGTGGGSPCGLDCAPVAKEFPADLYIVKVDSEGIEQWDNVFGGSESDFGNAVIQTGGGQYVVCGLTKSMGAGGQDVYVVKVDSDGTPIWERTFGGSSSEIAYDIVETKRETYVVVGKTRSFGSGGSDAYVIEISGDGALIWQKWFGEAGEDSARAVVSYLGGCVVAGAVTSDGVSTLYVLRLNENGEKSWDLMVPTGDAEFPRSMGVCVRGHADGYIILGQASGARTKSFVVSTNITGELLWKADFPIDLAAFAFLQPSNGIYVVTGQLSIAGGSNDFFITKAVARLFVRGDVNGNGKRDITDPIVMLNNLFAGGPTPSCLDAEDANDDGKLDVTDAIHVLNYLFLGEGLPPIPSTFCGVDPTEDELDCQGQPACMPEEA